MRRAFFLFWMGVFLIAPSSVLLAHRQSQAILEMKKPVAPMKKAEWTIMVYMNADNFLEPFAIQSFLDMAKVGSTDQVHILVQFDRVGKYDHRYGNWSNTMRFRVEKGMEPTKGNEIEDLGELDMGKKTTLNDFVNWGIDKYAAHRYMVVIWDHGQEYRMYQKKAPVKGKNKGVIAAKEAEGEEVDTGADEVSIAGSKSFKGVVSFNRSSMGSPVVSCTYDETSTSELDNHIVKEALLGPVQSKLNNKKVDIIGFDASLMAMVENAYAFKDVASYMVASQELEPGTGWQYDDWLAKLVTNPTQDGLRLSKLLVSSYQKRYQLQEPATTLSAVDLSEMENLALTISDFSGLMMEHLKPNFRAIRKARLRSEIYAPNNSVPNPYYHIDLAQFCDMILNTKADQAVKQKALAVKQALKTVVVQNYAGESRQEKFGSAGLAIYFPPNRAAYKSDERVNRTYDKTNKNNTVEFVTTYEWADFLQIYFKKMKKNRPWDFLKATKR